MEYRVCGRKLLFVEDDERLKEEMIGYFSAQNTVCSAPEVEEAAEILEKEGNFDAVILDLVLRHSMGLDLFGAFPALPPVIILSSLCEEDTVMAGLTSGAADYVTSPAPCACWKRISHCGCNRSRTRWRPSAVCPSMPTRGR